MLLIKKACNRASELYNKRFKNYYYEYNELSEVKKDKLGQKLKSINLKNIDYRLKEYDYDGFFTEEEKELYDDGKLDDMPPLEGDEAKEGKKIKFLTPNRLLIRLKISLTQTKAGNNSYKLRNEIRQILYLFYQHNKITKKSLQQFNNVIILILIGLKISMRI